MTGLLGQLFEQEEEFKPQAARQRAGLRQLLKPRAKAALYVIESHGQVLGMVSLLFVTSTALGKPVALLEDLVVDRHWRGQGLGSALLDHALAEAGKQGLGRVTLLTDPGNLRALALYRSRGFKPSPMRALRWDPAQD
jgi:ribosomal protein S18 acetylase RimI-like enzyme